MRLPIAKQRAGNPITRRDPGQWARRDFNRSLSTVVRHSGDQLESSLLCGEDGRIDPDGLGEGLGLRLPGDEAFGMSGPGLL